jgi:hypothetical protein
MARQYSTGRLRQKNVNLHPLKIWQTRRTCAEFERDFWAQVWQCTHRHPCKRCCWPWRTAFAKGARAVRPRHGIVQTPFQRAPMFTHRVALILTHYALILPFRYEVQVCHLCGFPPCCNPQHLVFGTPHDNRTHGPERGAGHYGIRGPIHLPNGVDILLDYYLFRDR